VRLIGAGDAALNSAADCTQSCLATLADAIAARTRRVNDIIGDDTLFPDERWGPGMSWNNIQSRYGTAASALTLDANELVSTVKAGKPGDIASVETPGYYSIDNQVRTVAGNESHVEQWREPHDMLLHLGGTIGVDAPPQIVRSSIDDPAHHAAWRLREMLIARGVKVKGAIDVSHRFARLDDTAEPQVQPVAGAETPLAVVAMEPLSQNVFTINKLSQNLFAELLLRRLGHLSGSGSIKDGQTALHAIMAGAGVPETGYDLSDGSGMSSYNRITPRAAVALLTWAARQPWGAEWRTSLPIGGKDGTLRGRFGETALDGRIFAKTGTLNAASALSGYMQAKSGATLIFSIIANDYVDDDGPQARAAMDAALLAIAEAN
jgi:D-alanyl-D-alanine carboxypeptidase/D-alanyl-D-alanine-endopeptidase (penicillin-binding protein 4)